MRVLRWPVLLVLVVSPLFGCERPVAPLLVDGAVRFQPPAVYKLWWQMTQECSGRPGLMSRVDWYYVPGASLLVVDGRRVEGYWASAGNTIVLAEKSMLSGPLVRHEMLHSLEGHADHSRELFLERCGGVVWCYGSCLDDAGPPPAGATSAARAEPDALEVEVETRPSAPSRELYGGHFSLVVTARNPRAEPVVVTLPRPALGGPGTSFEYRIETASGDGSGRVAAWDEGVTRFGPGETKRQFFDFRIHLPGDAEAGLTSGTYRFFGAYAGVWASGSRTVTVP